MGKHRGKTAKPQPPAQADLIELGKVVVRGLLQSTQNMGVDKEAEGGGEWLRIGTMAVGIAAALENSQSLKATATEMLRGIMMLVLAEPFVDPDEPTEQRLLNVLHDHIINIIDVFGLDIPRDKVTAAIRMAVLASRVQDNSPSPFSDLAA